MMTLVDSGTFVPKNPTARGEQQDDRRWIYGASFLVPCSCGTDHEQRTTPSLQSGGSGMPPRGPINTTLTRLAFEPDDDEPPYSRAFSEEGDKGQIVYPPADLDPDSIDVLALDGIPADEQNSATIKQDSHQSTPDDCFPKDWRRPTRKYWKEVE